MRTLTIKGLLNAGLCLAVLLPLFLLAGCHSSRKATSSRNERHEKAAPHASSDRGRVKSPTYPASEYYGTEWNNEHVSLSKTPPSGSVKLTMGKFVMPACGRINSEYGPRGGNKHTGIDVKVSLNDPIYCAFDGVVRMAKTYGAYGKIVVVRHYNGLETVYAHLNTIAVKVNQKVSAGVRLGGGGKTGRATGVHLHFETRFKGACFNPRKVVDFEHCRLKTTVLSLSAKDFSS